MSTSLDYFSRGLERAFAKRQAERSKQPVQKVNNVVIESNVQERKQQTNIEKVDSNITITTTVSNTASLTDEQYQTTIIQKMITHIKSKRNPV
ncbi:hypothetical protein PS900_02079 [Pseudomonas fluorescens]|uniref:Uncharacterized protein n=1 Tax=Pseudomonas fluorescens TaxID=294 RepID=A0A8H2RH97_PSEFL|nr:hypothetical protein [Pseudomonas fluorescens]VVO86135.1 hypothetical protein PS900_02079 [Pseudomonas fluorescens]